MARTPTAAAREAERAARMIIPSSLLLLSSSSVPIATAATKISSVASLSPTSSSSTASPSSLLFPSTRGQVAVQSSSHLLNNIIIDYNNSKIKKINGTIYDSVPTTYNKSAASVNAANAAAANATSKIRTLQDFVRRIPAAVQERKWHNVEPGARDDPIADLFRMSDLAPQSWQQYAFFDTSKPYTRNLIATDNETYTLLLLCCNPGQESLVHAHRCDECWLQVLGGQIWEVRYDTVGFQPLSNVTYHAEQLSWITDNIGYHKVGNASPPAMEDADAVAAAAAPPPP